VDMGKFSEVTLKETHKIKNKKRMKKINQKALTEKGILVTGEKKKKKTIDRKRIKCFNCNRIGRFSTECVAAPSSIDHRGNQSHNDYEAHMAKEKNGANFEEQPLMLMMITNSESHNNETWYTDSGCLNHMTGHKD